MIPILLSAIAYCLWAGIVFDQHAPMQYAWRLFWIPATFIVFIGAALFIAAASALVRALTANFYSLDATIEDVK